MLTIASTSALIVAPASSGDGASPVGSTAGRGKRSPTITAGSCPSGGGSGTPNQGPGFAAAGRPCCAKAGTPNVDIAIATAKTRLVSCIRSPFQQRLRPCRGAEDDQLFSLAPGPQPRRVLTLMPHLG